MCLGPKCPIISTLEKVSSAPPNNWILLLASGTSTTHRDAPLSMLPLALVCRPRSSCLLDYVLALSSLLSRHIHTHTRHWYIYLIHAPQGQAAKGSFLVQAPPPSSTGFFLHTHKTSTYTHTRRHSFSLAVITSSALSAWLSTIYYPQSHPSPHTHARYTCSHGLVVPSALSLF